jgi:hypothetical protein
MWLVALFLVLSLGVAAPWSEAATRLGLHVTTEELAVWNTRRTDTVNGVGGETFKAMWDNRILADANTFKAQSHPGGDGFWAGYTGAGCVPTDQSLSAGRQNGLKMMRAAFVFLVTGDTTYAAPVRTELLSQIAQSGTDFSNRAKWCVTGFSGPMVEQMSWMYHALFAYDYLKAGNYTALTGTERTNIEAWLRQAGLYWNDSVNVLVVNQRFSQARSATPPIYTCDGGNCPGSGNPCGGGSCLTHVGGATVTWFGEGYCNRPAGAAGFAALAGILTNDVTLIEHGKRWFKEQIRFAIYADGTPHDEYRWSDAEGTANGAQSSWGHAAMQWGPALMIADAMGRAEGNTTLLDYQSEGGLFGSDGSSVSLLSVLLHYARMVNGTATFYGSSSGVQTSATKLIWNPPGGTNEIGDVIMAQANLRYQNAEVETAYSRVIASESGCGGYTCWGGAWGVYPEARFMFGNLEGVVNPYNLGGGTSLVTITSPTSSPTYATNTAVLTPPLAGTADDPAGIASVAWSCNVCGSGAATLGGGGLTWSVPSITLQLGANVITVTATKLGGGTLPPAQLTVTYTAPDITSNLQLWLPFDDGTGTTAIDQGLGAHNAALAAGTTWVAGHAGPFAVHFTDNSGHLVTVSGAQAYATTAAPFTLALWTNLSSFPLALDYPQAAHLRSNGSLTFEVNFSNDAANQCLGINVGNSGGGFVPLRYVAPSAASLLGWHHLAVVYTGSGATTASNYTLYLDGVAQTLSTTACAGGKAQQTTLGGYAGDGQSDDWQGGLDEVRVYSRALTSTEVGMLAALAAPAAPTLLRVLR